VIKTLEKTTPLFILFLVALIGTILRCWGLNEYYFVSDESYIIRLAHLLDWDILSHFRREPHPPLYYLLLKLPVFLADISPPIILRSVSLVSGIVSIFAAYALGNTIFKRKTLAFTGAFLFATSPINIEQSQVVRTYSLGVFFIVLFAFFLFQRSAHLKSVIGSSLMYFLLIFTHFFGLLYLPALLFNFWNRRRNLNQRHLSFLIGLVCILSLLIFFLSGLAPKELRQSHISSLFLPNLNLSNLVFVFNRLFIMFLGDQRGTALLSWLFLFLGSSALIKRRKFSLFAILFFPFLISIVLNVLGIYPLTAGRHSIYLYPSFLILILFGFEYILEKSRFFFFFSFFVLLLFQIRSASSIFNPDKNRWRFGEGSPKFSYFSAPSKSILRGELIPDPLALDGGLFNSVKMEEEIKPYWGIFYTPKQQFSYCSWGAMSSQINICKCLQDSYLRFKPNTVFFLLGEERLTHHFANNSCFATLKKIKSNDSLSFFKVKLLLQTGETGRID
jgi:uncharacterized membrane protein